MFDKKLKKKTSQGDKLLGIGHNMGSLAIEKATKLGGRQKIKKVPSFSWEKFKIRRVGGLRESNKSQVPEGIKD